MPIEVMAKRGADTMRYGPLKPGGPDGSPHRATAPGRTCSCGPENAAGSMYNLVGFQTNLKFGEQKRVFSHDPRAGARRVRALRRDAPQHVFEQPGAAGNRSFAEGVPQTCFFAGQITGFEGYMESAACGLLAARSMEARLSGRAFTPPPADTMCGALLRYITTPTKDFQPMGANMGLLPAPEDAHP